MWKTGAAQELYTPFPAQEAQGDKTERETPSVAKIKTYLLNGLKPAPAERKWLSRMHGASWLN
jgi:hypothetical protein